MRRSRVLLPLLLAGAACGDATPAGHLATDSAGIAVVTSISPAWAGGSQWRVDPEPEVEVGDAATANSTMLLGVTGARRLEDGRYAVTLNEARRVQWFDRDGREDGRLGDDSSFASVMLLGTAGDSLVLWDGAATTLTVATAAGDVVRRATLPLAADSALGAPLGLIPAGVFPDGHLLLTGAVGVAAGATRGLRRDTIPLVHATGDGTPVAAITRLPGPERIHVAVGEYTTAVARPLGARSVVAIDDTTLLVSTGDAEELHRLTRDGTLVAIYRIDRPRRLIESGDLERAGQRLGRQTSGLPSPLANAITSAVVEAGMPTVYPTWDRMLVDETGAIWLREDIGAERGTEEPRRWTVLDRGGRWLGTVSTPAGLEVHQVTRRWVVGVARDPYGAELLRVHALDR